MPVPYNKVDPPGKNPTLDWERNIERMDFLLDLLRFIACIISIYAAWRRWKSKKND